MDGRQILDNVTIAHECIDAWHKQNFSGVVCKLDFEKAYDRVDWVSFFT